ncbi:hypothetical protein [Mucilaginibacter sp.]|uniref:hypothetical protein n=1 Tax=Mucilaginibacter sp. TaxID=1882438 RepID=UPI0025CE39B7|nr:hypothetical protein [Mucilaginibacter sp.]
MKITFICSSLQIGSDGVGDYVRRLACELIKTGHQVNAIALKDSYTSVIETDVQVFDNIELQVFRLPASLNTVDRYNYLSKQVNLFKPDVISLQYVGFGFHKYGLPLDILLNLRKAIGSTRLQIMLHELWCGMAVNAGFKEKVLGNLQKLFLKTLITVLNPETIFTSIKPYLLFLKTIGINATVVPIFGNIPTNEFGSDSDWENLTKSANLSNLISPPQKWLVLGFFGTTYNCPGLDKLLNTASIAAQSAGLNLGILAIGHSRGQNVGDMAQNMRNVTYWQTGALSPGMINHCMQLVDIGVVTSPVDGIDKSGSAITWMERGIPVIISANDKTYIEHEMPKLGIYQASSPGAVVNAYKAKKVLKPKSNLKAAVIAYAK